MKISANRALLAQAFSDVVGVVPTRSPKPILSNVKITCDADERTTLLATDLEVGVRRDVTGIDVHEAGSAVLPLRFGEILKLTNADIIDVRTEDEKIIVEAGRSSWELPSEDPDLFPEVPDFDSDDYYTVSDSSLAASIKRTHFATDVESIRYALGGVLWEFADGQLTAVGTNGRCLARQVIDAEAIGNPKPGVTPVVPLKALKLIAKLIGDDGEVIHIAIQSQSSALIRTPNAMIYSRLVEGRFPRYQDVFPKEPGYNLTIEAETLLQGVRQAGILTSKDSRGVDFAFEPEGLRLSASTADRGAARVHVPMPGSEGVPFIIACDPAYMVNMLGAVPAESTITIRLIDEKNHIQLDMEPGYSYVVMPLTRD